MTRRAPLFLLVAALMAAFLSAVIVPAVSFAGKVPQVRIITAEDFQAEVLDSPLPVLLQFHAEWCPYCRAVQPGLAALYEERADRLRVFKIDIDHDPGLARRFDVESIPTFVLLHQGKTVAQSGKVLKDEALTAWVDKALSKITAPAVTAPAL